MGASACTVACSSRSFCLRIWGSVAASASLTSVSPTHLQFFYDGGAVEYLSLRRSRDHEIAVAPIHGENALGGGFEYSWSVTGDLNLSDSNIDNTVVVRLSSSSTGTITASTGSMSATINVVAE